MDRCPTHPRYPYDPCPICEAAIEHAQDADLDADPYPGMAEVGADRYEHWLDEIGGSR